MKLWPLMLKSTHRKVEVENHVLRDALREANAELRKHRMLIADMRDGSGQALDRILKSTCTKPEAAK